MIGIANSEAKSMNLSYITDLNFISKRMIIFAINIWGIS